MTCFDPLAGRTVPGAIAPGTSRPPVLSVSALEVDLPGAGGPRNVVRDLWLELHAGETLALVGGSGGGKSVACLAIAGLLDPTAQVGGSVRFDGRELLGLTPAALDEVRGRGIGMIFQDATAALNPVRTIGAQLLETLKRHSSGGGAQRSVALQLLADVGLPDPPRQMRAYAHELSGGQCQRAMIALALAAAPRVLIADEPTSSLDVTIQAQILDLLCTISRQRNMALLLVTHDLGVVAQYADRVAVLYAGSIVESAEVFDFFERPAHPYARKLLAAVPRLDRSTGRLASIPGAVPGPGQRPAGCAFAPRCDHAAPGCSAAAPALAPIRRDHWTACFRLDEVSSA